MMVVTGSDGYITREGGCPQARSSSPGSGLPAQPALTLINMIRDKNTNTIRDGIEIQKLQQGLLAIIGSIAQPFPTTQQLNLRSGNDGLGAMTGPRFVLYFSNALLPIHILFYILRKCSCQLGQFSSLRALLLLQTLNEEVKL